MDLSTSKPSFYLDIAVIILCTVSLLGMSFKTPRINENSVKSWKFSTTYYKSFKYLSDKFKSF